MKIILRQCGPAHPHLRWGPRSDPFFFNNYPSFLHFPPVILLSCSS